VVEPPTPLKKDGVKVSWDDDIPQQNGKLRAMFQTTNQMNNLKDMGLQTSPRKIMILIRISPFLVTDLLMCP
jgi:hypothetical protein